MTFGERLKGLRQRKGVSGKQLGEAVGVTQSAISYFESDFKNPKTEVLIRIADYFEVTTDYLLRGKE